MTDFIEVHIISNRRRLDEFIQMWESVIVDSNADCTIKVLTANYPEKRFVLKNGIKVEYIKQRTFPVPKTTYMNHAHFRNELLCYVDFEYSGYILFFDDMQKPDCNILVEHLKYLKKGFVVCGSRLECDDNGNSCVEDPRTKYFKQESIVHIDKDVAICGYGEFWTCNSSVKFDYILKVNGFDNRFNGGTAGEDYDMAMRMSKLEDVTFSFVYNSNAVFSHYYHHKDTEFSHFHDTSVYKYLPEYDHYGKWELMESDQYELWWEGPIKYYKCKSCGDVGILDSIQVYHYNRDNNISRCENGLEQIREILNKTEKTEK